MFRSRLSKAFRYMNEILFGFLYSMFVQHQAALRLVLKILIGIGKSRDVRSQRLKLHIASG